MFGGLGFMLRGHMTVAASGKGGLLVRIDPAEGADLIANSKAVPMEMGGRSMTGWLHVPAESVRTERQLQAWVDRGARFAKALPPKSKEQRRVARAA